MVLYFMIILRDFFLVTFIYMIFTLDVDFKPNPHKMLSHCVTMYKISEKLQKEKHDLDEV